MNWKDLKLNECFPDLIEKAIALNTADQMGATDKALDEFVTRCGVDKAGHKARHMPDPSRIMRFPFSSTRKRMSTIIENATGQGGYDKRIMLKGASEIVLGVCSNYINDDG